MKEHSFNQPMQQSFIGIFVFFFVDIIKDIRRFFALFLILFVSKSAKDNAALYFWLLVSLIVVSRIIFSYLKYKNFRFYLKENSFILKHGVIRKSTVEIPFERIQNINIEQNIIQQLLQVVGVQIETAGEGDAEIEIKALQRNIADQLKNKLLEERQNQLNKTNETTSFSEKFVNEAFDNKNEKTELLFKLDFLALLKVGISSNFFKGIAFLFLFMGTIYNFVIDVLSVFVEIDLDEDVFNRIPETATVIAGTMLVFFVLGFLITVITTISRYFNLKINQTGENYELTHGLFKRVTKVIKKNKTQVVSIETNPIRKLFGIYNVFVSQASSKQLTENEKIGLVGISKSQFNSFFEAMFDKKIEQNFNRIPSSKRLIIRLSWRFLIFSTGIGIATFAMSTNAIISIIVSIVLTVLFLVYSTLVVKKSYLSVADEMICIGSGGVHTKQTYVALYKIQSVQLKQSIFQRLNGHADLLIFTASGSLTVPYLPYSDAATSFNYILYRVETSQLSWI